MTRIHIKIGNQSQQSMIFKTLKMTEYFDNTKNSKSDHTNI